MMFFDLSIKNNDLTIFCSTDLKNFSNEFIKYFNENIRKIKEELSISKEIKIIVALTDDEEKFNVFLDKNLKFIDNVNLNELNHEDRSFENNNGYNLYYIAIMIIWERQLIIEIASNFININEQSRHYLKTHIKYISVVIL